MSAVRSEKWLLAAATAVVLGGVAFAADSPVAESRWESAIQEFERRDRVSAPAPGGVLFVGSSSIRLWDLATSFPDKELINRGFGGSQIADSTQFAERIVLPYAPRTIVLYAGDNDIAGGKTPCEVLADFQAFVGVIHDHLPETRIVYIAIKPSLKRWNLVHKMRAANALIRSTCEDDERLQFVDIDAPMIGADGRPRPELFVDDGLHLSPAGYELWSRLVRPFID
ncbi:MAG: hypothetical protein KF861_05470 [Planctomycetaceae bacterium]|nr:hypothetical protein [Planctomycetaceae bacterium]